MTVKALCTPHSTKESKRREKSGSLETKNLRNVVPQGSPLPVAVKVGGEHPLRFKTGPNRSSLNLPSTLISLNPPKSTFWNFAFSGLPGRAGIGLHRFYGSAQVKSIFTTPYTRARRDYY